MIQTRKSAFDLAEIHMPFDSTYVLSPKLILSVKNMAHQMKNKKIAVQNDSCNDV